jgi:hypothetical protein
MAVISLVNNGRTFIKHHFSFKRGTLHLKHLQLESKKHTQFLVTYFNSITTPELILN